MNSGNKGNMHQPIGTILLDVYGSVPVYYIGGSAFTIEIPDAEEPMKLTKESIDKLIRENQIHINSPVEYAEIIAQIDPITGATATHNADGTKRSMSSQTLMMLENEGFLPPSVKSSHFKSSGESGESELGPSDDHARKPPPRRKAPGPESLQAMGMPPIPSPRFDEPARMPRSMRPDGSVPTRESHDSLPTDELGRHPVESIRAFEAEERQKARSEKKSALASWMQDKVNEENEKSSGTSDWDERLSEESHRINKPFALIAVIVVVVLALLFFGTHLLLSNLDNGQSGQSQTTTEANPTEKAHENGNQPVQNGGIAQTYTRVDFDPEASVQNFKDATQDKYDIAIGFFKTLKNYYLGGEEDAIGKLVAIESIGVQLANAYTSQTQTKQGLSEEEAATLREEYAYNFVASEKQHMKDRDSDASIFCGRIRDVKVDGSNDTMIYVVMESVSGDHQRACFILQSDASQESWALTQMENPSGYISMIMEGPYDNDYTYGIESGMAAENAS